MSNENNSIPRNLNIWLPLTFALVMVIGMLIGSKLQEAAPVAISPNNANVAHPGIGQGKIEELIRYIEARYVDEVDRDELIDKAIQNVLEQLDPHSTYIPADQLQSINESLEGEFDGIGIEFLVVDDTLVVITPIAGGPSETAGVLAGDKIIEVSDSIISGVEMSSASVMELLRGKKGTEVNIGVLRGDQFHEFTIIRDKIADNSVDIAYMLDKKTGYIKINRFSATTYEEFMKSLEKLKEKNQLEDLVIDLRGNPGGYLQEATNILSQLFKEKKRLMVYTEGRTVNRNDYETTGRNFYQVDDIVVLIDEGSASASEIVAGAMQDWDRGVIIGRRSFGKGLVQEQYRLKDGSALRLTVARYFTPSGRLIQKDYVETENYEEDIHERIIHGELYEADSILVADSTAFETAGGRTVYGGGGITPDIFVPFDKILMDKDYLILRGHAPEYVFRYLEKNKSWLETISFDSFDEFVVSDKMLQGLVAYANDHGSDVSVDVLPKVKASITQFIKARIAKHLYGNLGFYTTLHKDDDAVLEAIQVLQNEEPVTHHLRKEHKETRSRE